MLRELLDYNLLFRWFVGLSMDERIWDHSSFTKNRDRLIEAKVAPKLLRQVVRKARDEPGPGRNPSVDFHGEKRSKVDVEVTKPTHDAARQLPTQPTVPQANRGGLRLGQGWTPLAPR
jgi:hypothetical protein